MDIPLSPAILQAKVPDYDTLGLVLDLGFPYFNDSQLSSLFQDLVKLLGFSLMSSVLEAGLMKKRQSISRETWKQIVSSSLKYRQVSNDKKPNNPPAKFANTQVDYQFLVKMVPTT